MAESMLPGSANPFAIVKEPSATLQAQESVPIDATTFGAGSQAMDPSLFSEAAADSGAPQQGINQATNGEVEDARVAWRAENQRILESREVEEKQANDEAKSMAQAWLKKFQADRDARIAKAKEDNAAQEQAATKGPVGDTNWEKVQSMIDFSFKPPQEKETERERFKQLLMAAKEEDVPCSM